MNHKPIISLMLLTCWLLVPQSQAAEKEEDYPLTVKILASGADQVPGSRSTWAANCQGTINGASCNNSWENGATVKAVIGDTVYVLHCVVYSGFFTGNCALPEPGDWPGRWKGNRLDILGAKNNGKLTHSSFYVVSQETLPSTPTPQPLPTHASTPSTEPAPTTPTGTGFLGLLKVNDDYKGVLIVQVLPNGPADQAGLIAGDIITAVDNTPVKTMGELAGEIAGHTPGSHVSIAYVRNGQQATASTTLWDKGSGQVPPRNDQSATASGPQQISNGVCQITSFPDAADVTIDGNFVGNTPARVSLAPGKHTIRLSVAGYKEWVRDITVLAGSELTLYLFTVNAS